MKLLVTTEKERNKIIEDYHNYYINIGSNELEKTIIN